MKKLFAVVSLTFLCLVLKGQPITSTNAFIGGNIVDSVFNFLPAWDPTLTNTFNAGEIEIEMAPVWKNINASGLTPYFSLGANYMVTRNFGFGGEVTAFGRGDGQDTVDTSSILGIARKDSGNMAAYALVGVGRDFNQNRFMGEIGPGFTYRYKPGIGVFIDTRFCISGSQSTENGFLTRAGITFHF